MTTIALLAWPLLTLALVLRLPFHKAALISLMGGFLLLPTEGGVDLPVLPPLNKDTIPSLTLLVLAILLHRKRGRPTGYANSAPPHEMPGWIPRSTLGLSGLLLIVLGSLMTAMTNRDPLFYGPTVVTGMHPYDGFSLALGGITMLVPLLLGRKFFAHPERHALLLHGLIVGGLAYSLLALYEIRMSPQLNNIVYGFFPHDWRQHVRGGGWRPVVFMQHGLQLTLFLTTIALAAFGAARCLGARLRSFYLLAGMWLLGILILSNSFGALAIAMVFLPATLFLGLRLQLLFAATIAAIIIAYPMLRSVDVIPTAHLVTTVETINARAAESLQVRLDNEDMLLEHGRERPLFGWGGYGRNRIYDEAGRGISITDGAWIIVIGIRGWAGYLGQFGLLTLPIIILALNRRRYEVSAVTAVLALVLSAALIDLLPNAFLSPVILLLAGALWGRLELGAAVQEKKQAAGPEAPNGQPAYARAHPSAEDPEDTGNVSAHTTANQGSAYTRQTVRHRRLERPY